MTNTLAILNETKGVKREFPFLTSVKDYIIENYSEIVDLFESDNIAEVINEVRKYHKSLGINLTFVSYKNSNELELNNDSIRHYRNNSNDCGYSIYQTDKKDGIVLEGLDKFYLYADGNSHLSDIYYISDADGYAKYEEELRAKDAADRLARRQAELDAEFENERKLQVKVLEDIALRKEFSLKPDESTDAARAFKQFTEGEDKLEKFEAFKSLGMDVNKVRDIAVTAAEDAIDEHEMNCDHY